MCVWLSAAWVMMDLSNFVLHYDASSFFLTDSKIRTRQSETGRYQWLLQVSTSARSFRSVRWRRRYEQVRIAILSKNLGWKSYVIITLWAIFSFSLSICFVAHEYSFCLRPFNFNQQLLFLSCWWDRLKVLQRFFFTYIGIDDLLFTCNAQNVIDIF
jgi:hypothetical protein